VNFALILLILLLVSGAIWAADALVLRQRRPAGGAAEQEAVRPHVRRRPQVPFQLLARQLSRSLRFMHLLGQLVGRRLGNMSLFGCFFLCSCRSSALWLCLLGRTAGRRKSKPKLLLRRRGREKTRNQLPLFLARVRKTERPAQLFESLALVPRKQRSQRIRRDRFQRRQQQVLPPRIGHRKPKLPHRRQQLRRGKDL